MSENNVKADNPLSVAASRPEYNVLRDPHGDLLPVVDAFCKGYAEAILFANAYRYVYEPEDVNYDDGEMEPDENAQYAYQWPGEWWVDMGIDFTDAIDFLAANVTDLTDIVIREVYRDENRFLWPGHIHWTVYEQHGHDFALTRNGHGAGFWDRGYGAVGDRLTEAAQAYGEHSVLTDDGSTVTTL